MEKLAPHRKLGLINPAEAGARSARKREAEKKAMAQRSTWQATWVPLGPTPAPPRRPGADNYLAYPSRIGDERRAYAITTPKP
ncbi:hypothetical protein [Thiomonas sp.]|jgi:hypothetical protein|uniref:hypothetical protein n=1 Tax=Thiomonas sp. TaxID=2047785 RepID=UPI0025903251|nr:hypothetical protein [Thiomonas sp.]